MERGDALCAVIGWVNAGFFIVVSVLLGIVVIYILNVLWEDCCCWTRGGGWVEKVVCHGIAVALEGSVDAKLLVGSGKLLEAFIVFAPVLLVVVPFRDGSFLKLVSTCL